MNAGPRARDASGLCPKLHRGAVSPKWRSRACWPLWKNGKRFRPGTEQPNKTNERIAHRLLAHALHPEVHPVPAGLATARHLEGSELDMQSSPAWVTT